MNKFVESMWRDHNGIRIMRCASLAVNRSQLSLTKQLLHTTYNSSSLTGRGIFMFAAWCVLPVGSTYLGILQRAIMNTAFYSLEYLAQCLFLLVCPILHADVGPFVLLFHGLCSLLPQQYMLVPAP